MATENNEKEKTEEMSVVVAALIEGYLEVKLKSSKHYRPYFVCVHGGTLFYYRNELDVDPKGLVQLEKTNITALPDDKEKQNVLQITISNDNSIIAAASNVQKRDLWVETLLKASALPAQPAPPKDYVPKSKKTLGFRAKKSLGSKFVGSKLGKQSVESVVMNDHVRLIRALHKIVEAESDKQHADRTERAIIKIVMKTYLETITTQDLIKMDAPLREGFNLMDKIYRQASTKKSALLKDTFVRIEQCFAEVVRMLSTLLKPHIRPKNMLLMHQVAEHIGSAQFMMHVWDLNIADTSGTIDGHLFELVNAMSSYTQVELVV